MLVNFDISLHFAAAILAIIIIYHFAIIGHVFFRDDYFIEFDQRVPANDGCVSF